MDPMGDVVQVVHSEDYFEKKDFNGKKKKQRKALATFEDV